MMNDDTIIMIENEIRGAKRFIKRHTPNREKLEFLSHRGIISQWGCYDLGAYNAEINAKLDLIDILNNILQKERIKNVK